MRLITPLTIKQVARSSPTLKTHHIFFGELLVKSG